MRIAIIAGETSGDLLGAGLIRAVTARCPEARFEGIGGPGMTAAGCEVLYPMERLAVIGLREALRRYRELHQARRQLIRRFTDDPPDLFVGIDAPDFNLSLEMALRRAGVPTVHYVSPQVWAWRGYRIAKIRRAVSMMLTLFPFEEKFFLDRGVRARFVGHPLADIIPDTPDQQLARRELELPAEGEIVAMLPGSRLSEVSLLADPMVGAARWLARRREGVRFIVPLVNEAVRSRFETALGAAGDGPEMRLLEGHARTAMAAADAVLLASGTASLEALLLKRPMVITYRLGRLSWWIARRVVKVPFAGLPNLLAGRALVPELLQDDATPAELGAALLAFLENPQLAETLREEFRRIHATLRNNADERAADAVLEVMGVPAGTA
ncbi:MAG: lipid-A-disaccharide synthase [Gammaproteobacteria bacterium]|nr:lipid-A-disaccharide synthase [Gammaproteobacteria bacterium]NIM73815.1 lipid-A-disaccharide synthase [Gammaproteobacteria bacterium]NIN39392.1 lipid-A-disaccharide synthase [Gammaproteobacteria bacterium]NIO25057.1 lipid-A-disaccharide synthase [Gammaproteobacteria bacterium]NIO65689.1 lipid-A-disaccharide synthase [Gammaproteobacteria bacterium]